MTKVVPKLKKMVSGFLVGEDGRISKSNILNASTVIISAGVLLSSSNLVTAQHSSSYYATTSVGQSDACVVANHSSHGSHGSHGSHASHGSHGSW